MASDCWFRWLWRLQGDLVTHCSATSTCLHDRDKCNHCRIADWVRCMVGVHSVALLPELKWLWCVLHCRPGQAGRSIGIRSLQGGQGRVEHWHMLQCRVCRARQSTCMCSVAGCARPGGALAYAPLWPGWAGRRNDMHSIAWWAGLGAALVCASSERLLPTLPFSLRSACAVTTCLSVIGDAQPSGEYV
jgi:hypothetical protein